MKIRSLAFAVVALAATSVAFAEAASPKAAAPQPAPREQTLLEGIAVGMREILQAVAPEISLPALEIKLPAPARR